MTQPAASTSARRAVRRAVRHLRRSGLDGPRPIDEIEVLAAAGQATVVALGEQLGSAPPSDLAATVCLARLLGLRSLADRVGETVLRCPAPLDAKVEAVEMLRQVGVQIPAQVERTLQLASDFLQNPDEDKLRTVCGLAAAWQLPILQRWLVEGGGGDVASLRRLLGLDPELDQLVARRLGESGSEAAVEPLLELADGDDRKLSKSARRALHQLRSAGINVDAPEAKPAERFSFEVTPDVRRETRAFVSGIDGTGARLVWMLAPSSAGGQRLLEAVIDDVAGLRRAEVMAVTRTDFRDYVERLRSNRAILVVQADTTQVAQVLVAAEQRSQRGGAALPSAYEVWRREVAAELFEETSTEPAPQPIWEHITLQQVQDRPDLLAASVELLAEPYFASWAIAGPACESAAGAVRQAETSQLVLDDQQREQQVKIAIGGVAASIDSALRELYRERLEHMAQVLWSLKLVDKARLALAAGVGFSELADLYADHPFARALIQRGVAAAYQVLREAEEQEEPARRIITP